MNCFTSKIYITFSFYLKQIIYKLISAEIVKKSQFIENGKR